MGWVEINHPDGTRITIDEDGGIEIHALLKCDSCNEPKALHEGSTVKDRGLDLMWICDKCNTTNYDKSSLTKPKEEEKND